MVDHNGPKSLLLSLCLLAPLLAGNAMSADPAAPVAIAIHGGAGTIVRDNMTPELEAQFQQKLGEALQTGHAILTDGGTSLDAVAATIEVLENSPLFNAGKGAVFNAEGVNELDASIMDGSDRQAGAVAGVRGIANPIHLARAVMDHSPHVMLMGDGAVEFAVAQGFATVDSDYFHTERRWQQLQDAQKKAGKFTERPSDALFSTVGAVALDQHGNLAAGTSTGGMTNKRFGRVGDSPIIGAGTWADNAGCAVSATGHGEYFIRTAVAHEICAQVRYRNMTIVEATDSVVQGTLKRMGGSGGVVAMDPEGNIAYSFNTAGMYRGGIDVNGEIYVGIYSD